MEQVSMRLATIQDASTLHTLAVTAYQQYEGKIDPPPKPVTYDYASVVAERQTWVVVLPGDEIIGMVTLVPQQDHVLARNMCLLPEWQGRGLAVEMTRFCEHKTVEMGFGLIKFWTNAFMTRNIIFYERLGYELTHRSSNGEHSFVHFQRDLGSLQAEQQDV